MVVWSECLRLAYRLCRVYGASNNVTLLLAKTTRPYESTIVEVYESLFWLQTSVQDQRNSHSFTELSHGDLGHSRRYIRVRDIAWERKTEVDYACMVDSAREPKKEGKERGEIRIVRDKKHGT